MGDDDEAQDAVQEACLRAYQAFASYNGGDGRSWLLRIVRNTSYTMMAGRRRGARSLTVEEELGMPSADPSPEDTLLAQVDRDMLKIALEGLPAEFREVIVLRELEDLSYREIAAVADLPIGTVMSRLARARDRLRTLLSEAMKEAVDG